MSTISTGQAINLHLSSFAVDIEAAQAAEESLVHHFVLHGRHKEAVDDRACKQP